jgi:ribosomal protein S18 acetylase RimI-like enzyme
LKIVDFEPRLAEAFKRLNYEWLERYFHVEDIDRVVLSDPQTEIIGCGGQILFAVVGAEAVGTVALKHHGEGRFELTKMAVTASYQGQGIGQALLVAAIRRFGAIGGRELFLESHSSLKTAIKLYESAGFCHASHPSGSDYVRSDTYMVYRFE